MQPLMPGRSIRLKQGESRRAWHVHVLTVIGVIVLTAACTSPALAKEGPMAIAASPDGQRLYVTTLPGAIQAIDIATQRVVASITTQRHGSNNLTSVVVSPDSTRLYVTRRAWRDTPTPWW
jgi:DNA-binding beta-propeller fold protein YncE